MKLNVYNILRRKYPEKEFALMAEVSDMAGFGRSRSADYVVVNLWPSRGLEVYGIELKSFRGDWLNELKKPDKAENIFKYCDRFYLLTTDATVAKIEEIPPTWGWMHIKGNGIKIVKEAPKLTPEPISKNFLATMLKRAQDKKSYIHVDSVKDEIEAAKQEGIEYNRKNLQHYQEKYNELLNVAEKFKEKTGINLNNWAWRDNPEKLGEIVRFINDGGTQQIKKELIELEENAKNIVTKISTHIQNLKSLTEQPK